LRMTRRIEIVKSFAVEVIGFWPSVWRRGKHRAEG
jgi:hypothetical protein